MRIERIDAIAADHGVPLEQDQPLVRFTFFAVAREAGLVLEEEVAVRQPEGVEA